MARAFWVLVAAVLLGCALPGHAASPDCPDAELFSGKLFTDIPWSQIFPIRVAGLAIGAGDRPAKATDQALCLCEDNLGVPHPGLTVGLWQPARIVELVHAPGCAPALGGIKLPLGPQRLRGTTGQGARDNSDAWFMNYHYYAFPLLILLDLFFDAHCNADGYVDFDVLSLSELDPTWNEPELAFLASPETALFASPVALAACAGDCAAATAGTPMDSLFWCAGCWGNLYPASGYARSHGGAVDHTSLYSARILAMLHRRGQAWLTMGDEALCRGVIYPMIPKSQYKLSMFYPVPETDSAHPIGASTFRWGLGHTYPGLGETAQLYLLWRWHDCCHTP